MSGITFMLHRLLLAVVTLASAMTAFSDSALPVGAPMFEIDGRDCLLRPLKLEEAALDARIHLRGADHWQATAPAPSARSVEAKIALENAQENLIEYSRAVEEEMMPYAVLEREIEKLDAEQQNSVVMFVRFLVSQKAAAPLAEPRAKVLHRVADENAPRWLDEISGIASLPRGQSDSDLVYDAIAEKHGVAR